MEFALKFRATVKAINPKLPLADQVGRDGARRDHRRQDRGVARRGRRDRDHDGVQQTVVGENGLEVWRRLMNRFNPMTPVRGLQIMLKVVMPPKIGKLKDVHGMVNKWEGLVHVLERDYKENISDMMKISILIHMTPEELQDSILHHADKIKEYKLVKEKAVNLVDAMDVCYYGHYEEEGDNDDPEEEVGACR